MTTYNHMAHVRYSIFDAFCCECAHPGLPTLPSCGDEHTSSIPPDKSDDT